MAQLEILQCSGCGSPLAPGTLTCAYCGNKNIVKSKRDPLKITSKIAGEYISFYAKKTKKNPKDTNALYAMGLLYLNLKNYELAQRSLKDAIDRSPLDADVYYYYALSLPAGGSIGAMGAEDVGRMEQYLGTAIQMEVKCKYLVLLAVVREEYYMRNHLVCEGDTPQELFGRAADYAPEELDEITEHCTLCGEDTMDNIGLLTGKVADKSASIGKKSVPSGDGNEQDEEDEEITDEQVEAAFHMPQERRRHFYDYRFEPLQPDSGFDLPDERRLHRKESWMVLMLRRTWKLGLNLLLSFVLLAVCQVFDWGFLFTEHSLDTTPIAGLVAMKEEAAGKKITAKERAGLIGQLTTDSLATVRQDSLVAATHIRLMSKTDEEKRIEEIVWVKRSVGGCIWFIVVLSPLLVWLLKTVNKTVCLRENRREANRHNRHLWDEYAEAVELYRTKPTVMEIQIFILNYLSGIVDKELDRHGKSEKELKGKTLFVNGFFGYREDGENYEESAVEYTVALLEQDCVSVITSDWRVYEDAPDDSSISSIAYSDIREVKLTDEYLSFGGIKIGIPDEPLFEYQNDAPDDGLTYSTTCTSDIREFVVALRKLYMAHKNNHNH